MTKFKVGDLVTMHGLGDEYKGVVIGVGGEFQEYPYNVFIYIENRSNWYKEKELTLNNEKPQ